LDPEFLARDSQGGTSSAVNKKRIVRIAQRERRSTLNKKQITRIAQLTLTTLAALTLAGYAEARNHPSNKIILVRPTELPELAREPGQAMLIHDTGDGETLLYVEQNHGARLAIFDVTDPARVKQETAVRLDAPGSFDFVSPLGDHAEVVRFRHGQGEAVLDLHKAKVPTIKLVQGLNFQGPMARLGDDGFMISNQASVQSRANALDYQVVETANAQEPNRVYDVKQVREEITNDETGTTFLLTADGLYLIRRPAVEEEYQIHEYQMSHPG
jgi:hypothetical protein